MGCGASKEVSAERIAEGLREALTLAVSETVKQLGAAGGFAKSALRIKTPGTLGDVLEKVKMLPGIGGEVEEFEDKMNEAAEAACGAVQDIFTDFIGSLNFSDAKAILEGGAEAATGAFRQILGGDILARFTPIVHDKVGDMGLVKIYTTIKNAFESIPFNNSKVEFDVPEYVKEQSFESFFKVLGQFEAQIRQSPAMRQHSQVLQEVFGSKQ